MPLTSLVAVLVLLDIDGTLLLGSPRAHQMALAHAAKVVVGVPCEADDVLAVKPSGRVDREIIRLVLQRHGEADGAIDESMAAIIDRADREHARLADRDQQVLAPHAGRAIAHMRAAGLALAPLTGNIQGIARRKLTRAGLAEVIDIGAGAFGSDADTREELVPIARRRAGVEPLHPVVVVGDTPRDIDCARAGGARCIAVTTSGHGHDALAGADHVAEDLGAAASVVVGWHREGQAGT